VDSNAIGVKYGKFEPGFLLRRFVDYKHFHRRLPCGFEDDHIFPSVLRYALVLDLSDVVLGAANPAAIFESYWNPMLEAALRAKDWVVPQQSSRSESRQIVRGVAWQEVRDELAAVAPQLMTRILEAAEVLARK